MSAIVNCPNCQLQLEVPPEAFGKSAKCYGCQFEFRIGQPASAPAPPPSPAELTFNYPPEYNPKPTYEYHLEKEKRTPDAPVNRHQFPEYARRGKKKSQLGLIIGVIAGTIIFVIGPLIALLLFFPSWQSEKGNNAGSVMTGRADFTSRLNRWEKESEEVPVAPASVLQTIKYDSPAGAMSAYVSRDPDDGQKHPAIIWLFGGFSNSISEVAWEPQPQGNDQSASQYRRSGVIMMYPSLRGGNNNPGFKEGFFGEVDDVLAAAEHLASLPYVDPDRIYLGGHSTGGTLALLCASSSNRFRAVLSLGPVEDVRGYGQEVLPFDVRNSDELEFRNPMNWVGSIRTPTFIVEGENGNAESLQILKSEAGSNPAVKALIANGQDHFSIVGPMNQLFADKIANDDGPRCNITLSSADLDRIMN